MSEEAKMDWGLDWDTNPDEAPSGGTSPFIEAPGIAKVIMDLNSIEATKSSNKGTPEIKFILLETEPTEGLDKDKYEGRRRSNVSLYLTPKTWGSKEKVGVTQQFIKKLFYYVYGVEKGTKVSQILSKAVAGKSIDEALLAARDVLADVFKKLAASKTSMYCIFEGDVSYTAKDDGSGHWRNIYPRLHMMGSTLRAATPEGLKELQAYYDAEVKKAEDKGKPNPFLNDEGEPPVTGGGFNSDFGDTSDTMSDTTPDTDDDFSF